ncbi:MAG: BMP family ABC transporter substrate-binding protein, partial [Lachnospiraceae bacterium]|nr:BMP family ABC transporter substrate-binding protein [Lachnospiraceae bacterium]
MASEDYIKALRSGKSAYRRALSKGEYPYLPALDEIVETRNILTEEPLGLVSIPLEQIVGTKTAGRQAAFASNFMPLMPENSEFARKWDGVVKYHLDQGVGDPIVAYEYMNRFYVLEGNKRV